MDSIRKKGMRHVKVSRFVALSLCTSILLGSSMMLNSIADDTVNSVFDLGSDQHKVADKKLTKSQVVEDIDCVLRIIKEVGFEKEELPAEVEEQKELEISKLADEVSVVDEYKAIIGIVSKMKNSNTILESCVFGKKLPIGVNIDNKKVICTDEELKGFEINSINGISIEDMYNKFKSNFPKEVEGWAYSSFFESQKGLMSDWKLALSGIDINSPIRLGLTNGSETKEKVVDLVEVNENDKANDSWETYTIDKNKGVGVFRLDRNSSNEEYSKAAGEFFEQVKENNLKSVVVDLRDCEKMVSDLEADLMNRVKDVFGFDLFEQSANNGRDVSKTIKEKITKDNISKYMGENNKSYSSNVLVLTSNKTPGVKTTTVVKYQNNKKTVEQVSGDGSVSYFGESTREEVLPNSRLKFIASVRKSYKSDSEEDKLTNDTQNSQESNDLEEILID